MSNNRKKFLQKQRVPLGFAFAALFLIFAEPTIILIAIGAVIAFVGVLIRAWSSGHIRKNQTLAISGPYAHTRNPLYLGSFILGAGLMLGSGVWWLGLLFAVLFLGIYLPVMSVESDELTEIFGDEYKRYSESVPLFLPRLSRFGDSEEKFEKDLYIRYREYRAFLGYLALVLVLIAKTYLFQ